MNPPGVGVSLDDFWLRYSYLIERPDGSELVSRQLGVSGAVPDAILLPRLQGESCRFDIGTVAHPRGTGRNWPPEAIVDTASGSGRLPLGGLLHRIEHGNSWYWQQGVQTQLSCTDCLAAAISQLRPNSEKNLVVAVPNHWNVSLQQELLDSFQKENIRARLLWRPIAAAFEWFASYGNQIDIDEASSATPPGKLLCVHIGYADIEITELELVPWKNDANTMGVVPGRKRPGKADRIPGFGFRQLLDQLSRTAKDRRDPLFDDGDLMARLWNGLWCSSEIPRWIENHRFRKTDTFSIPEGMEAILCGVPQMEVGEVRSKLQSTRKRLERVYFGVVLTGPMASRHFQDGTNVSAWLLESLQVSSSRMLIEGGNASKGVVARGASRFAQMLQEGWPTYLDTLPRLEMVILEKGEPTWVDLLEPDQKWVEGGREWQRPERVQNLFIAPQRVDLKLAISHQDFDHVREVVAMIPQPTIRKERVSLSVKMTPAQGNARLEVHPDNPDLFGTRRVFIDWHRLTDFLDEKGAPTTKEGYLNAYPRIFPELLPRLSSPSRGRQAIRTLRELMAMMNMGHPEDQINAQLKVAREKLREKDQSMYPHDATAFDSEGNCQGDFRLEEFMEVAWPYFQKHRPSEFIRCAGYTHVNHVDFHEMMVERFSSGHVWDDHVVAAGKCFRNPRHISVYVNEFISRWEQGWITQLWWKALSEMLRFRGNALQEVSSPTCTKILETASEVFVKEQRTGHGRELFRLACLVIVYTLRRRAFDDAFLEPESPLAIAIKNQFLQARVDAAKGRLRLMGGSVDLSQQLQLIIDYVDRRGKGQLLIGD
jgi:hypothetical protein